MVRILFYLERLSRAMARIEMARSIPRSGDFLSFLEAAEKRNEAVTRIHR